jgi:hypothetical protein
VLTARRLIKTWRSTCHEYFLSTIRLGPRTSPSLATRLPFTPRRQRLGETHLLQTTKNFSADQYFLFILCVRTHDRTNLLSDFLL